MAGEAAAAYITQGGNIASTLLQNRYNRKMVEKQNKLNLEQWNRQNQYNSPVEQMKRLSEAGLNPNLMYSQGNVGNASGSPSFDAPQRIAPRLEIAERMAQVIALKNAQIQNENAQLQGDLMKSQNEYNQQRIFESIAKQGYINAKTGGQIHSNWLLGNMVEGRTKTPFSSIYESQLQALKQDVNNKVLTGNLLTGRIALTDEQKKLQEQLIKERKYWNDQREQTGIEKSDNVFFRGGLNLTRRIWDNFAPDGLKLWLNNNLQRK